MIAWVTRNLITRDLHVMRNIYKCIIRPHLEYCAQLWSPPATHGNWSTIIELESVQRRFTRLIDGIGTIPYSERLEALQLPKQVGTTTVCRHATRSVVMLHIAVT